jgi:colanic acid biosynthesis glycosyl transferase WcaI
MIEPPVRRSSASDDGQRTGRTRVLVLNQYYTPGVEATAQLLGDLCRSLAEVMDVTVITGRLREVGPEAGELLDGGVRVIRVNSSAYDRRHLSARAVNYITYLAQSLRESLRRSAPDVILCMTDPPIIADVALVTAKRFGVPLIVVSQDVFPEVAVELRRLQNPIVVGVLDRAIRYYLQRADRVVAIGERMRTRLEAKGTPPDRLCVIPNWVDTSVLVPVARDNAWSRENGLVDRFVVMHSGNVGYAQDLDTLVRSGTFLRDLDDLDVVVIGSGARYVELVDLAARLDADCVRFLGYQPRERLAESLSSAHVHVIGLAAGLAGYVVPSRLYGVLSVGRPVIASAEADSETAQIVDRVGCGVVVPPGRPELLAAAIRRAHDGELDLEAMGARGREFVLHEADRSVAHGRYRELIEEVARTGARR